MGMDLHIEFSDERAPQWEKIAAVLTSRNIPLEMRMIDGELAFPDETPTEEWQELRVGTPHGMITVRRAAEGITLVIWGNADCGLIYERDQLAEAIAEVTQGRITRADEVG